MNRLSAGRRVLVALPASAGQLSSRPLGRPKGHLRDQLPGIFDSQSPAPAKGRTRLRHDSICSAHVSVDRASLFSSPRCPTGDSPEGLPDVRVAHPAVHSTKASPLPCPWRRLRLPALQSVKIHDCIPGQRSTHTRSARGLPARARTSLPCSSARLRRRLPVAYSGGRLPARRYRTHRRVRRR